MTSTFTGADSAAAASAAVTLTFFALFGTLFLVSQYLQSVLGYSAMQWAAQRWEAEAP